MQQHFYHDGTSAVIEPDGEFDAVQESQRFGRRLRENAMSMALQTGQPGECPMQILARAQLYEEYLLGIKRAGDGGSGLITMSPGDQGTPMPTPTPTPSPTPSPTPPGVPGFAPTKPK